MVAHGGERMEHVVNHAQVEQHVFCVDDDPDFLKSISLILPAKVNGEKKGIWYEFSFFEKPIEALEMLEELAGEGKEVALVISDHRMPQMTGLEFLSRVKKVFPDGVRLLLTGYAGLESAIEAINDQLLDRYLTKPIEDEHDFVVTIRQLLQTYQMRLDLRRTTVSKNYVEKIIGSMTDSLIVLEPKGRIAMVNPAIYELLGYRKEELVGRELAVVFGEAMRPQVSPWISEVTREGFVAGTDSVFETREKKEIPVSLSGSVMYGNDGGAAGIVCVAQDITDRIEAQEELKNAKEAAEAANTAKSEFLARMSHEIRTPMNGVLGMTELLLETELSAEQRHFAETVHRSGVSLLQVINDILDFSKIEAGKLEMEFVAFDLRELVEEVVELFAEPAHRKQLELACLISEEVPVGVEGDPGRLRQILANLISNAIKFTEEGEVVARVACIEERGDEVWIRFEICDTGIGIAPERQRHIFDAFVQADESTTRKYGGTGLGLAITKQLTEMMGGSIGVESDPGKGTTFWFLVRLRKCAAIPQPANLVHANMEGLNVLVVDDNHTNRDVLHHLLDGWGIRHACAADGLEALRLLYSVAAQGQPFNVAMLDKNMPGMDGLELARLIKADAVIGSVQLVMLSSLGCPTDTEEALRAGIQRYLHKPVRGSQLFNCLTEVSRGVEPVSDAPGSDLARQTREDKRYPVKVLIAEDNAVNREVACRMVKSFGCQVDVAGNGGEAIAALSKRHYDLVFMDCQMPEMDGFEATRRIREKEAANGPTKIGSSDGRFRIPIIALTAHVMKGDQDQCFAAGMDDYLGKPFNREQLRAILERWALSRGEASAIPTTKATRTSATYVPQERPQSTNSILDRRVLDEIRSLQEEEDAPSFVEQVIDLYLKEAPALLENMGQCLRNADPAGLRGAAHTLKSCSANLGATALAATCKELEMKARANDLNNALRVVGQIEQEFQMVRQALETERHGIPG